MSQTEVHTRAYRDTLGTFATGIAIVTAVHPTDGPVGLTANSFSAVSLTPPLVLFCAARTSTTWPAIRATGRFCVNILAEHQEELSRQFTGRSDDRFRGIGWRPSGSGAPILPGVASWMDCRIETLHEAGDHTIVIGRIDEHAVEDEQVTPLLYYRSRYARLGAG
ncbi:MULTISPECIES: flavin reductase family protein [unclassified Pseudofrankia]|uniref:flavin reductase family protein n=1 Tax=unclassified Pseudofrankia TaxID=2994372 RepID=UPI0008D9E404|nr:MULTISPECIES: flavin reductase family protein [unclassified Pseudofrankia]MDT3439203.1 flavin reductase family protein [Pseudofrankia sp. BMG5.37]OHV43834.1 flavin oxidoreductase [Pseudofrankia sp. BMG5.36]